jgi:hypothetical protein
MNSMVWAFVLFPSASWNVNSAKTFFFAVKETLVSNGRITTVIVNHFFVDTQDILDGKEIDRHGLLGKLS